MKTDLVMNTTLVTLARRLATMAHEGQVDKAGEPYVNHVDRVARVLRRHGQSLVAAGYLHDVLEDTEMTADGLLAAGVPAEVVRIVETVTRREGEGYEDFIKRVSLDRDATLVKLADNVDNSSETRLAKLDPATAHRLRRRYQNARSILVNVNDVDKVNDMAEVMNQEVKTEWLRRLRSGDYTQGSSNLRYTDRGDGRRYHCCLGVLCEMAEEAGVVTSKTYDGFTTAYDEFVSTTHQEDGDVEDLILPQAVMRWAGLTSADPMVYHNGETRELSTVNDAWVPFSEIADLIEEQL